MVHPPVCNCWAVRVARPETMLLFSTRTGTARSTPAAGGAAGGGAVVSAVVVVEAVVVAEADASALVAAVVVRAAVVVAGASLDDAAAVSESASELDNDIAPRPAKTMASAINTIASARRGGPPEVGLG